MDKFENGYALLIGTGSDQKIKATVNDVLDFAELLKTSALYPPDNIRVLTESSAKKDQIIEGLKWLAEEGDREKTVLIYYAGHGEIGENDSEFYLIPFGFDKGTKQPRITAKEFTGYVNDIIAKKLLVIMSCCHASGLTVHLGEQEESDFLDENQKLVDALYSGTGRVIISSCHSTEKSYIRNPDEKYTIFGEQLLEATKGKAARSVDQYVSVLQIMHHLFNEVPKEADEAYKSQRPMLRIPQIDTPFILSKNQYYKIEVLDQSYQHLDLDNELVTKNKRVDQLSAQLGALIKKIENSADPQETFTNQKELIRLQKDLVILNNDKESIIELKQTNELVSAINEGAGQFIEILIRKWFHLKKGIAKMPENFALSEDLRETEKELAQYEIDPAILAGKQAKKIMEALDI